MIRLNGEEYTEDQILNLIDQSIVCGTTKDLYDIIIKGSVSGRTKERVIRYLTTFMFQNNIIYDRSASLMSTKKISDIIEEHRSKKIDKIVK